jgi:hypothetical protein
MFMFVDPLHLQMIIFMALVLGLGLTLIQTLNANQIISNNYIRKSFHILAVVLFLPGVLITVNSI